MSMGTTPERCTPASEAYGLEQRKQLMRDVVRIIASKGALRLVNAPAIAATYGVPVACAEAEMMKHMTEGGEK